MTLGHHWLHNLRISPGNHSESGMGCEFRLRNRSAASSRAEVLETIDVLSECGSRIELGWEAGSLYARFKKLNKDGLFSLKPHDTSDLAFSDSFIRFHPFASVFGFCQCNDTRNVTRFDRLPGSPRRKPPCEPHPLFSKHHGATQDPHDSRLNGMCARYLDGCGGLSGHFKSLRGWRLVDHKPE